MKLTNHPLEVVNIDEPALAFGYGQRADYPKDGLFLYGPHTETVRSKDISLGVVGTREGISRFRRFAIQIGGRVRVPPAGDREKESRLHLSDFPGIEEAFRLVISPGEFVERQLEFTELDRATKIQNLHEAVRGAVDSYIAEIEYHDKNEEQTVDVWIIVLPELIFNRCRPLSRRTGLELQEGTFSKQQNARAHLPLLEDILDMSDEEIFDDVPDFHRQIKARLLRLGYTSQVVRETTLAPNDFLNSAGYPIRHVQEPATVAWNFSTGLYYKTQAEPPWKLADVRSGVCYVGLVFKQIPNDPRDHACCAAQMFLNEGDAAVFRGANGPWKTSDFEFHLEPSEAKRLVGKVLETFREKHGASPKELFIHGRTTFSEEEWQAFSEAAPEGTNVVTVRIKRTAGEAKLFRNGDYPVLRGTALLLDDRNAYLWTSGFVPRLDTYMGPETPNPLLITVLRSTSELPDIKTVLKDIMGLTKINYNGCFYNDGLPVTVRFADRVGDVLTMGSARDSARQPLKFYI